MKKKRLKSATVWRETRNENEICDEVTPECDRRRIEKSN